MFKATTKSRPISIYALKPKQDATGLVREVSWGVSPCMTAVPSAISKPIGMWNKWCCHLWAARTNLKSILWSYDTERTVLVVEGISHLTRGPLSCRPKGHLASEIQFGSTWYFFYRIRLLTFVLDNTSLFREKSDAMTSLFADVLWCPSLSAHESLLLNRSSLDTYTPT